jgi:uracil-DNA glycosylase
MTVGELPLCWREKLAPEFELDYFHQLTGFVTEERLRHLVFPSESDVFAALRETPLSKVRAIILGQDPYHGDGQAHGLSFSVRPGIEIPPSLRNIFRELQQDLGICPPGHGCLLGWARQGVLLLNAVLTVRAAQANSHANRGWELFTDAAIRAANEQSQPIVFVLWGAYAQKKVTLIDQPRHNVISSSHPSPLSAHRGFFGSKPFSRINAVLEKAGRGSIDWAHLPSG